ncbi:class II aldolase/adducin family protein, partial [Mycobacterium tuberculosis]|nr:class II aldolase/adducin family protein [Mycobacterium tuberculosis]
ADSVRRARIDLAACLRWAARHGLEEGICNHFSAVLPERPDLFLVNPAGLAPAEATAPRRPPGAAHGPVLEGAGQPQAAGCH